MSVLVDKYRRFRRGWGCVSEYPGCVIGRDGQDFPTIADAGPCVIRGEFWKNVGLFVRIRGYGVCGGTH